MVTVKDIVLMNVVGIVQVMFLPVGASMGLPRVLAWDLFGSIFSLISVAYSVYVITRACPKAVTLGDAVSQAAGSAVGAFVVLAEWIVSLISLVPMLQFTSLVLAAAVHDDIFSQAQNGTFSAVGIIVQVLLFSAMQWYGVETAMSWLWLLSAAGIVVLIFIVMAASGDTTNLRMEPLPGITLFDPCGCTIMFGYAGIELSAFHMRETSVQDYQDSVAITVFIVFLLYAVGQTAVMCLVPRESLDPAYGAIQALRVAATDNHTYAALCIGLGLGTMASNLAWLLGPIRGVTQLVFRSDVTGPTIIFQNVLVIVIGCTFMCTAASTVFWWLIAAAAVTAQAVYISLHWACFCAKPRGADDIFVAVGAASAFGGAYLGLRPPAEIPIGNEAFTMSILVYVAVLGVFAVLLGRYAVEGEREPLQRARETTAKLATV